MKRIFLTAREAEHAGFLPLTVPYRPDEERLMGGALASLTGCRICLVETRDGPEIWRHKGEMADERAGRYCGEPSRGRIGRNSELPEPCHPAGRRSRGKEAGR